MIVSFAEKSRMLKTIILYCYRIDYQYVFLLFPCTKQLLTAINNKVKNTLDSTSALYYKFYHEMNYELISLTELNQKNIWPTSVLNVCFLLKSRPQKASGGEWPLATMTHICQLYGTAQQISHS